MTAMSLNHINGGIFAISELLKNGGIENSSKIIFLFSQEKHIL